MKRLIALLAIFCAVPAWSAGLFDMTVKSIKGEDLALKKYQGQVLLVTNIASQCGFTPQLEGLEKLYQKYKEKGLVILGVPSNDFGGQTPESNQDMAKFCRLRYGVTFPLTEKMVVKGEEKTALARYLVGKGPEIQWNFEKFLINAKGQVAERFNSSTTPDEASLLQKIEKLLP